MNELYQAGVNGCIQGPRKVNPNVKEMIEAIGISNAIVDPV